MSRMTPMLYLLEVYSRWRLGITRKADVEPMLEVKTASVNVAMDIPEGEIDQRCTKHAGKDQCDNEVGSRHSENKVGSEEKNTEYRRWVNCKR
jgi:hypothetical protein